MTRDAGHACFRAVSGLQWAVHLLKTANGADNFQHRGEVMRSATGGVVKNRPGVRPVVTASLNRSKFQRQLPAGGKYRCGKTDAHTAGIYQQYVAGLAMPAPSDTSCMSWQIASHSVDDSPTIAFRTAAC